MAFVCIAEATPMDSLSHGFTDLILTMENSDFKSFLNILLYGKGGDDYVITLSLAYAQMLAFTVNASRRRVQYICNT